MLTNSSFTPANGGSISATIHFAISWETLSLRSSSLTPYNNIDDPDVCVRLVGLALDELEEGLNFATVLQCFIVCIVYALLSIRTSRRAFFKTEIKAFLGRLILVFALLCSLLDSSD